MASPVILAYTFVGKYAEGNYGGILGILLLVTLAFGVLGYYAFVNRKSERPGMAFVFPWVGTIIRFMIVVPGGLGIGLERLTMQILGEENVRETCLFPRDMNRLEP